MFSWSTPARSGTAPPLGLHDALHEASLHFDVVRPGYFRPSAYRALLIGNAVCPDTALEKSLVEYARAGGLLIVTAETSLRDERGNRRPDFAWSDLLGIRYRQDSPYQEANYASVSEELRDGMLAYPILFTCPVLEVECTTARPLAELLYPEAHRTEKTFLWETQYTHFKGSTGRPLITVNRFGSGTVVYIAAPVGEQIASRADVWLKRLVANAVRKYAGALVPEVTAPAGVQVVYGRKPGLHVLSLVNLYAGTVTAPGTPVPRVGPVTVRIPVKSLGGVPRSVQGIDLARMRWQVRAGVLEITADSLRRHAVVAIA
jgi:hypothetical protein